MTQIITPAQWLENLAKQNLAKQGIVMITAGLDGWGARIEGKALSENPYIASSPEFEFWNEGWNTADGAMRELEKAGGEGMLFIYLNGMLVKVLSDVSSEDLASSLATDHSEEHDAYVDDLQTRPDGSFAAYLLPNSAP